jgi:hypothetical protein
MSPYQGGAKGNDSSERASLCHEQLYDHPVSHDFEGVSFTESLVKEKISAYNQLLQVFAEYLTRIFEML